MNHFREGRLVVNVIDVPIKCPVAPLEFCFLADWHLRQRGLREGYIHVESEFATGRIDADAGRLHSWDEREVPYDLLVAIPVHGGPDYVARSPGLGDELGFIAADRHTLRSKVAENVFVIGDAADVPTSKAGSVTHFEGETVVGNIQRHWPDPFVSVRLV